jgi:DNA polymerase-3 subunit epsilon
MKCIMDGSRGLRASNHFVILDVETTGLSPLRGDRVIEIGAVAVERNAVIDEFHSLINPGKRIPIDAQLVHGITDEMLIGQPKPEVVFPLLSRFIRNSVLVAHNARFDIGFLSEEFGRLGLSLVNRYHCTLEMSRVRYPRLPNHKLKTVYRHVSGKSGEEIRAHRALGDARMVAAIWMEMTGR